jgi:futalosine hydrolase
MKMLIAASTIQEIAPLMETPDLPPYKLIITGVGAMATIYSLTKSILEDRPDLIIQAGVAGAFKADYLGEVCIVKQDRFADLGVEENKEWRDLFDMGLAKPNDHPFTKGWLENEHAFIEQFQLPLVSSITINEITTNNGRIESLKSKYQPAIESMEGAALHFVCLQEQVPFFQLRCVSNYVGERNKSKWEMAAAIKKLNTALSELLAVIGTKIESA